MWRMPRPRLQQLDRRFLHDGAAGGCLRRRCCHYRTWTTPSKSCGVGRECRASARAFIRPMFIEGHYFTHPYYDPLWGELESLGIARLFILPPDSGIRSGRPTVLSLRRSRAASIRFRDHRTRAEDLRGVEAELARTRFVQRVAAARTSNRAIISYWLDNHMFVAQRSSASPSCSAIQR